MERQLNRKIIIYLFQIPLLITLFGLVGGCRFTPIQAIKSSSFIKGDINIFGEVDRDWTKVYLLEAQNGLLFLLFKQMIPILSLLRQVLNLKGNEKPLV